MPRVNIGPDANERFPSLESNCHLVGQGMFAVPTGCVAAPPDPSSSVEAAHHVHRGYAIGCGYLEPVPVVETIDF